MPPLAPYRVSEVVIITELFRHFLSQIIVANPFGLLVNPIIGKSCIKVDPQMAQEQSEQQNGRMREAIRRNCHSPEARAKQSKSIRVISALTRICG